MQLYPFSVMLFRTVGLLFLLLGGFLLLLAVLGLVLGAASGGGADQAQEAAGQAARRGRGITLWTILLHLVPGSAMFLLSKPMARLATKGLAD